MILKEIEIRQENEKVFHNKRFANKRKVNYYDLAFNSLILEEMVNKIGNIEGKKVLECGCGNGWLTKIISSKGAEVWAFDISDEAVKNTKNLVNSLNLQESVHVSRMSAEKLLYNSNMFDLVLGNAILHHVDLNSGLMEIKRVLKDGGKGYFVEPLGHNPFLNLYRKITPSLRSKDEVPLRFEQFSIINSIFSKFEHEEYYLTTLFALLWYFLGLNQLMFNTRNFLFKLDKVILSRFLFMRKYCWYSIIKLEK